MISNLINSLIEQNPTMNKHYLDRYIKLMSADYSKCENFEIHHILPRSMFPQYKNLKSNKVKLSLKAHFLAHWILAKMLPDNKDMTLAYYFMCNTGIYKINISKDYEKAKLISVDFVADKVRERVRNKKHNFCDDNHPSKVKSRNRTHHLFGGEIQRRSNLARSKNGTLPSQNVKPWNSVMANAASTAMWKLSDEIYDYYTKNKHGHKRTCRFFMNKYDIQNISMTSVKSIINKFKLGWIPSKDTEWLNFKNGVQND